MQALKESKKISRRQPGTGGSSKGTGRIPGVPNESAVIPATSSEGTGSKQESEYSKEGDDDEKIKWVDTDEEEEKNDDDDDKSIDLKKTEDEKTNDEFVHGEEHVQDDDEEIDDEFVHGDEQVNDDEDEEMTNAKVEESRNGDAKITDAAKADAKKTEEIPQIQSSSTLTVPVSVIFEHSILTPIPETPSVAPATTLLPPPHVSSIPPVLLQTTPLITTETPSGKMILDPLHAVIQRVSVMERDVQELKEVDRTTTILASLRVKIPSAVNVYLGTTSYKEMIEESVQANLIYESIVKNELENTLLLVAQSSSQAQSSLKAAESLFEYELKIILFENIDKSCSYLTHEKHQALFDALLNSMSLDDAIAHGQVDPKKVLRKRDRDDKDPSAGPNQGKPPAKTSKSGKSVTIEEPVEEPVFEMAFDDIEQTINDVVTDADQIPNDSTQSKDKATKQDWFKQLPRPPTPDPEWNKR
ncbi:hypothetical protein Tco_0703691 [Tanacetum coccineum]|uniref:Uncharacterized protein n=1 Tax=Tanacetum coccineum TaxID=301880 RepID=A0ABQ4Y0I7_9ASTR